MARKTTSARSATPKAIETYEHTDKTRPNNPPVGLVNKDNDPETKRVWTFDPHLSPSLQFAGRVERDAFEVATVSLHVHERIDPRTILQAIRKTEDAGTETQPSLFGRTAPLREAVEFYKHPHGWANRLVAGDSLLAMNSLIEKENLGGQVQMVFFDPPYGINYGSNFQPLVTDRSVGDSDADLADAPETLRAFRDTWSLEIHSYLSYLRERFLLIHHLLHESGSLFVQINDENLAYVRILLDEIFGRDCRVVTIPVKKKGSQKSKLLDPVNDYLVWYSKSPRESGKVKFHKLFEKRVLDAHSLRRFGTVELDDGREFNISACPAPDGVVTDYRLRPQQLFKDWPNARLYYADQITGGGVYRTQTQTITFKGQPFVPGSNKSWKTSSLTDDGSPTGMQRLEWADRLVIGDKSLNYKRYFDDFGYKELSNWWDGLGGAADPLYVVQTNEEIVQRCILMTTDPGDLVLDPTCGSGTTAFVAEQWGRRWITCDTSRVAIALARQRLMTSAFEWYQFNDSVKGVGGGFKYEQAPHVTLGAIANNPRIDHAGMSRAEVDAIVRRWAPRETLYDQPLKDSKKSRVSGPFTVEAMPSAVRVMPLPGSETDLVRDDDPPPPDASLGRTGETVRQSQLRDELLKTGIIGRNGQRLTFVRVSPLPTTQWLHGDADLTEPFTAGGERRVVVSFGPEHAPLDVVQIQQAVVEARALVPQPVLVVFAAYQFDPEAAKDIDETDPKLLGMQLVKVQMNPDLLVEDLKKKRASNESFWLVGQPDVDLRPDKDGRWVVEVRGFDYFNVADGTLDGGNQSRIAFWMLDTDYDSWSVYPRQFFFRTKRGKDDFAWWTKKLDEEIDPDRATAYTGTVSLPFAPGARRRVAVKVIDTRGIESLIVKSIPRDVGP